MIEAFDPSEPIGKLDAKALARIHGTGLRPHSDGYTIHLDDDRKGLVVHGWRCDGLIHPGSSRAASNGRVVSIRPEGDAWRAVRVELGRLAMTSRTIVAEGELEEEFEWARGD